MKRLIKANAMYSYFIEIFGLILHRNNLRSGRGETFVGPEIKMEIDPLHLLIFDLNCTQLLRIEERYNRNVVVYNFIDSSENNEEFVNKYQERINLITKLFYETVDLFKNLDDRIKQEIKKIWDCDNSQFETEIYRSFLLSHIFNLYQRKQIILGHKNLSLDQVLLYANKDMNSDDMQRIRVLLEKGLTYNQILEDNEKFDDYLQEYENDHNVLEIIKKSFSFGLTIDQSKKYIESGKYSNMQLNALFEGISEGLTDQQIEDFINPNFNSEQITQIWKGLIEQNLKDEQIKLYANPQFDWHQMQNIRLGFNCLSFDQVKLYAKPEYKYEEMNNFKEGLVNNLTIDQINFYLNKKFNLLQTQSIIKGFKNGLSEEQISLYAKKEYDYQKMNTILDDILNELNSIANYLQISKEELSNFNNFKLDSIMRGIRLKVPKDKLLEIIKSNCSENEMTKKINELINKYFNDPNNFNDYLNYDNDDDEPDDYDYYDDDESDYDDDDYDYDDY